MRFLVIGLLGSLILSVPGLAAQELLHGADFGQPAEKVLSAWQIKPEEKSRIEVRTEAGKSFLRCATTAPESAMLRQEVPLPPDTKNLILTWTVRTVGVAAGEKKWQVPRIAIHWYNDPEKKNQWVRNWGKSQDWTIDQATIAVPEGAKGLTFWIGTPKGTGTLDVATLSLTSAE